MSERKTIAGMECINRKDAAEHVGMCQSTFDKILKLSKQGKAKVPLKFIQYTKCAPIWFPIEWLDSFVLDVMREGRAV